MISEKVRTILIAIFGIAVALIIILLVLFVAPTYRAQDAEDAPEPAVTCVSEECQKLSARMKEVMDETKDPCTDFYAYACGRYGGNQGIDSELKYHMAARRLEMREFMATFGARTKSEEIAMIFWKKCLVTRSEALNEDVWAGNDLTDLLLEMAKIDPVDTGLIKNRVAYIKNGDKNAMFLVMTNGVENGNPLKTSFDTVLSANPSLSASQYEETSASLSQFQFIDLQKYLTGLLPKNERATYGATWRTQIDANFFALAQKVFNSIGIATIKSALKTRWRNKLQEFIVTRTDNLEADCFKKTEALFPGTLGKMFAQKFVGTQGIEKTQKLFDTIKKVFAEMLNENTWIDKELKNVLQAELAAMEASIGIADDHKAPGKIEKIYERIEETQTVEQQSYLTLARNLLKMNSEETFLRVAQLQTSDYAGQPMRLSANYATHTHRVSIDPLFLTPFFMHPTLPKWNTIASLGFFTAHEVGHAFDALNFFEQLTGSIQMSAEQRAQFETRIQCLVAQYNAFTYSDGSTCNGELTKQENSADMIGFDLAWRMFLRNGRHAKLVGFDAVSPERLFLQRLAFTWCAKELSGQALTNAKTDTHSAFRFRVNGMMSNSPEFAQAYGCAAGTPMNPAQKCTVFE